MLVALPSAIAFVVTVYAPLGGSYAAMGAIAGIIGVVAIGISSDMLLLMVIILGLLAGAMQIIFTRPLKFPCHPDRITNSKGMTNEQIRLHKNALNQRRRVAKV